MAVTGPAQQSPIQTATGPKDTTPPPTPQVQVAVAYVPATRDELPAPAAPAPASAPPRRDPAYIQLNNIEAGTTIQFINLSKNPAATFEGEKVSLKMKPVDVMNRRAGISLDDEQLKALDLQPGDMLSIRAVDDAGNASPAAQLKLDPNQWAGGPGRVGRIQMMQDAFTDKVAFGRGVVDSRPPSLDGSKLALKPYPGNPQYFILSSAIASEPNAQLQVINTRVNAQQPQTIAMDAAGVLQNANLQAQAGDNLRITIVDSSGVRGTELTAVIDMAAPNGLRLLKNGEGSPARPQTPQLRMAAAYDSIPRDTANTPARPAGRRDPLYIELGNVDAGMSLELVNLSRDPSADFGKGSTPFKFSSEDATGRRAALKLDEKQLATIDYQPGDVLKLRIVDGHGLFSDPLVVNTDTSAWAGGANRQGNLTMMNDQFSDVIAYARTTTDTRPALLKADAVKLVKLNEQTASVQGKGAMEPGATAQLINTRTGQTAQVTADADGAFAVNVVAAAGDTLLMRPFDRAGVRGEDVELKYSGG